MEREKKEKMAVRLGYKITPCGTNVIGPDGRPVSFSYTANGYPRFSFGPKIDRRSLTFHRLQAIQQYGDAMYNPELVCRHLDGNPRNNSIANIALGTQKENAMDRHPDDRRKHARRAARFITKFSHLEVIAFYREHGWTKTLAHYRIPSKGTLSYILRKSDTAKGVTA